MTPRHRDGRGAASLDLAAYAILVALALSIWGPLVRVGLNLPDEGWLLTAIDRLVAGERLYADVYRSYAPGLYWFFEGLFRAFDADLVTVRWVWLAAHALISVQVYRLARLFSPAWIAFSAALVVILLRAPVHKTFVPLCYVASLWLCHRLIDGPASVRRLCAIGMSFGLVGLVRQEAAAFGLLIGLASLAFVRHVPDGRRPRLFEVAIDGAWITSGVAIVWLPVVMLLLAEGSLGSAVEQLVVAGARGNAAMSLPFPDFQRLLLGPDRLWASLFFMPAFATVLGVALTMWVWRRQPGSSEAVVVGQWTIMALLAHTVFASRTDLPHLLQALVAPTLILAYAASLGWRTPALSWGWPARAGSIAIGLWMLMAVVTVNDLPRQYALRSGGATLQVPGNEVIVHEREAVTLRRLVEAIEAATDPSEPIFVLPYTPGIYHLAGRHNPTRHDAIMPGYASDIVQAEVIEALESSGTRLVVIERIVWDGRRERALAAFAPELVRYLANHFVAYARIGRFSLMERR